MVKAEVTIEPYKSDTPDYSGELVIVKLKYVTWLIVRNPETKEILLVNKRREYRNGYELVQIVYDYKVDKKSKLRKVLKYLRRIAPQVFSGAG